MAVQRHQHNDQDDRGATMVEYSLMAALIALVCVGAVSSVGERAKTALTAAGRGIEAGLDGNPPPPPPPP